MTKKRPTAVLVIAILHFVFGGLGVLIGVVGIALQAAGGSKLFQPAPPPQAGQNAKAMDMSDLEDFIAKEVPGSKAIQTGDVVGKTALSICMIIAGVGLVKMQSWGRWLSVLYGLGSIALHVLRTIYFYTQLLPALQKYFDAKKAMIVNDQKLVEAIKMIEFFAMLAPLLELVTIIYPIIVLIVMFLPSVSAAFRGELAGAGRAEDEDLDQFDRRDDLDRPGGFDPSRL